MNSEVESQISRFQSGSISKQLKIEKKISEKIMSYLVSTDNFTSNYDYILSAIKL
jgi:hypothetical protein